MTTKQVIKNLSTHLLPFSLVLLLNACATITAEQERYFDPVCLIEKRKYVMTAEQHKTALESGFRCNNTADCIAFLTVVGAISLTYTASTAIIAGSTTLVGNTFYWLEEQVRCRDKKDSSLTKQ